MRLITNKTNPNYTINSILHARFHCVFTLPTAHSGAEWFLSQSLPNKFVIGFHRKLEVSRICLREVESIILISLPGGEIYSILIESLRKCYFCTQEGYFKL